MVDELIVLNEGINLPTDFTAYHTAHTYNTKVPINPRIVTKSSTSDGGVGTTYLNCYEIHDEDVTGTGTTGFMAANMSLGNILNRYHPTGSTVEDYGVNLLETPGYRIVVDKNLTTAELGNHDYFVVIYADDPKKHHVAKVTDVSTYNGNIKNIDFTPALKENIAYGTKVVIYQGSGITGANPDVNTLVAVGYGLLKNSTDDRHGNFVEVSKPTFYFYKDLEPDTKYVALKQTNIVSVKQSVFKTAPITSNFIIDKSFYTQNAYIVDNNKVGDEAATKVNYAQYDGTTGNYTLDITDWDNCCKNYDFENTNYSTYIKPVTSPNKNQYLGHMMNIRLNRSITNKGNMCEVKFIDNERMLERKINEYENFNVKELIGKEKVGFKASSVLPGIYTGSSSTITITSLDEGVDLKDLLGSSSPFELIYIGDYYYKLSAIGSVSAGSQTLTVSDRRKFTDYKFEGSSSVSPSGMINATAYRNIWSGKVNNLIVSHTIDTIIDNDILKRSGITLINTESDINGLEYTFLGNNEGGITLIAKRGNSLSNYVELNDTLSSNYYSDKVILDYIRGSLIINKKVFKGKIEYIETDNESGIFSLTILGRDEIATLLSYPINKNLLYSKEWVASTISPITGTGEFTDTGLNIGDTEGALNANTLTTTGTSVVALTFGDVLYVLYDSKYTPLGVVSQDYASSTTGTINLLNDCLIDPHTDFNGSDTLDNSNIYVGLNKLLAGKSLHNHYRTTPHVSLYGAADKGMVFYGKAKTINKTGSAATDGVNITSLNGTDKNYGIDISGIEALEGTSDAPKDSPYGLDFDYRTIGSLSHLHLIGEPTNIDDDIISLEIGNISPIVMARMDLNDTGDAFYTNGIGLYFLNKQGIDRGGFIHLLDHINDSDNKGSTWRRLCVDDRKQQTNTTNYAFRFGSPIFRYSNLSDTKLTGIRNITDNRTSANKTYLNPFYLDKTSMLSAYASALRVMGDSVISKTSYKDYTNSWQKENPPERTWRYPASGSMHQDIIIYDNTHRNAKYNYSNRLSTTTLTYPWIKSDKQLFEMDDPMSNPLFLFAPGDMLPDSQKRPDHIFFNGTDTVTRNESNYYLLIKYKDTYNESSLNHDNHIGNTKFTNPNDNNYELLPISSNLTNKPRRFNLLRLVPVTYDSYMNEVDYETYPIDKQGEAEIAGENEPAGGQNPVCQSIPSLGYSVYKSSTTSATSTSNQYMDVTTTIPFDTVKQDSTGLGGSSGGTAHLSAWTNPADDSTGYSRLLGYLDPTDGSSTATRIYFQTSAMIGTNASCLITGYEGEILVIDSDPFYAYAIGGNSLTNPILKNEGLDKFPFIKGADKAHNHNIHSLGGFDYSISGTHYRNGSSRSDIGFTDTDKFFIPQRIGIYVPAPPGVNQWDYADIEDFTYTGAFGNTVRVEMDDTYSFSDNSQYTDGATGNFHIKEDDAEKGWYVYFNYRQKFMRRGTRRFRHKGNIQFADHAPNSLTVSGDVYDTVIIKFEGFSGVQIGLSNHFEAGDSITVSGSTDTNAAKVNTTYIIISVNNPSVGDYGSIMVRPTSHAFATDNTSSYESGVIIETTTVDKHVSNMGCHTNRFINNMSRRSLISDEESINTFNGLDPILVTVRGSAEQNTNRVLLRERRQLLSAEEATNIGEEVQATISASDATLTSGAKNRRGGMDIIELQMRKYWNYSNEEIDDAILLFRPSIDLVYTNTVAYSGTNSKYTSGTNGDEGFIRIEVESDLDDTAGSWTTIDSRWIDFAPNLTGKTLIYTLAPTSTHSTFDLDDKTHNIINHTISKAESSVGTKTVHYLHIDNYSNLNTAGRYQVYKFATTTTQEDKSNYPLYFMSRSNIINPLTNKFFTNHTSNISWYDWERGAVDTSTDFEYKNTGFVNDGFLLGMYVIAELDGTGSPSLVHRNETSLFASSGSRPKFIHDEETTIYMTDGIKNLKTSMKPTYKKPFGTSTNKVVLEFSDMEKFRGSVSIGDVFSLKVQGNIKSGVEYVKIVTPFNIAPEVEQSVDAIFGENNIPYTQSTSTDKYYVGNNFTGEDSYTAINKILENKDLKLHINGDNIKIVSNEMQKNFRSIEISEEDNTYKVVQIKKDKSLLDNFNEIIVYGDGYKGIARDYSNIKKIGKTRSKEIFDYSIINQKEVDRKAIKYLKLYNKYSEAIELTIANDLPLLEAGHIITLNYPSEGLHRHPYTVIEIIKILGLPTKLLLGRYNKDLSNTLSGILSITKDLQGNTKRNTYASVYVPNVNIQRVKLKFIQAKVTTGTDSYTIGFGFTIGFDREIEL